VLHPDRLSFRAFENLGLAQSGSGLALCAFVSVTRRSTSTSPAWVSFPMARRRANVRLSFARTAGRDSTTPRSSTTWRRSLTSPSSFSREPHVSSDVAPCTIHHGAYDQDLMGVSPDYDVRVSPRLLEDDDGPMLDLLKTFRPAADLRPAPSGVEPGTLGVALRAIP
jgi:hypothetical protein